jgi:hypothetical protein
MSSYATYCRDQATDCARRARLTRSAETAVYYRDLGQRWLRLAAHAEGRGGAFGDASQAREQTSFGVSNLDPGHGTCTNLEKLYQELRLYCVASPR